MRPREIAPGVRPVGARDDGFRLLPSSHASIREELGDRVRDEQPRTGAEEQQPAEPGEEALVRRGIDAADRGRALGEGREERVALADGLDGLSLRRGAPAVRLERGAVAFVAVADGEPPASAGLLLGTGRENRAGSRDPAVRPPGRERGADELDGPEDSEGGGDRPEERARCAVVGTDADGGTKFHRTKCEAVCRWRRMLPDHPCGNVKGM